MALRKMPERLNLGQHAQTTMEHPIMHWKAWLREGVNDGRRYIMGYAVPSWQRPLVWTRDQMVSFIESAWLGVSLGTYAYNRGRIGSPFDDLLIDGQQRMFALESYLKDEFPVFGCLWSETTIVDKRMFQMTATFACYITETEDEAYLRNYYNLLNFGGTPHKESERA